MSDATADDTLRILARGVRRFGSTNVQRTAAKPRGLGIEGGDAVGCGCSPSGPLLETGGQIHGSALAGEGIARSWSETSLTGTMESVRHTRLRCKSWKIVESTDLEHIHAGYAAQVGERATVSRYGRKTRILTQPPDPACRGPHDVCTHRYCYEYTVEQIPWGDCVDPDNPDPNAGYVANGQLYIPGVEKDENCYVEKGKRRPLVLIMRADKGQPLDQTEGNHHNYFELSLHLASHGFVVASFSVSHDQSLTQALRTNYLYLKNINQIGPYLSGDVVIFGHSHGGYAALNDWDEIKGLTGAGALVVLSNSGMPAILQWKNPPAALLTMFDIADKNGESEGEGPYKGYAICAYDMAGRTPSSMPAYRECLISKALLPDQYQGHWIQNGPYLRAYTLCFLLAYAVPNPWNHHFRRVFRTKKIETKVDEVASMWPDDLQMEHSEASRRQLVAFPPGPSTTITSSPPYSLMNASDGAEAGEMFPHCGAGELWLDLGNFVGGDPYVRFDLSPGVPCWSSVQLSIRLGRMDAFSPNAKMNVVLEGEVSQFKLESMEFLPGVNERGFGRTYLFSLYDFKGGGSSFLQENNFIKAIALEFTVSKITGEVIRVFDIELLEGLEFAPNEWEEAP